MGIWKKIIISNLAALLLLSGGMTANFTLEASASASACAPYGPWENSQYDPAKVMEMMGSPRNESMAPLLSAHRGAWNDYIPENSIAAIDNAAAHKFEMVELDIKMTRYGEAVLMHDYTLGRMGEEVAGSKIWDPFSATGYEGWHSYKPQEGPNPNWMLLEFFNPVVSVMGDASDINVSYNLRTFNKSVGTLGAWGPNPNAVAAGSWQPSNEKVPTLQESLQHIGDNYPGMTVVLDLRHLNEVWAAIEVIDGISNCQGLPAKDWVILKPFANVFKGGWGDYQNVQPETVLHEFGNRAYQFKWIPVISNRLVSGQTAGKPSIIPSSPGPDTSQIPADISAYIKNWVEFDENTHSATNNSVVTIELGIGKLDEAPANFLSAYNLIQDLDMTNMQSWRPPDVSLVNPNSEPIDPSNGKVIIGFNWNDDGLGVRPVHRDLFSPYSQTRSTAGVITADDVQNVLGTYEVGDRYATKKAISRDLLDPLAADPGSVYKLINRESGLILDLADGAPATDGTRVIQYPFNGTPNQNWRIVSASAGGYFINNDKTGKKLDIKDGSLAEEAHAIQWQDNGAVNQRWDLIDVGDGYFRIVNKKSGKALETGYLNSQTYEYAYQSTYSGEFRQQWKLVKVPTYKIINFNSQLLLDLADGAPAVNGTKAIQHFDNGTTNQKWKLVNRGLEDYKLINEKTARALTIHDQSPYPGAHAIQWENMNGLGQLWNIEQAYEPGYFKIWNKNSQLLLDIRESVTTNAADVFQWTDYSGESQLWKFVLQP